MNQKIDHKINNATESLPTTDTVRLCDKFKDPGNVLIGFFVLNVLVYMIMGFVLGGWALSGRIVDGHYYLGSKNWYTPVNQTVYTYSLWHGYSQPTILALLLPFPPKRKNRILL